MITKLVITDLTRMHRGKVCIAGYDASHQCVRPTLPPPGIDERILYQQDQAIVYPFALVELDLLEPEHKPPHTEDVRFDPGSIHHIRTVMNRQVVLEWSLFKSVAALFEQPVHSDFGFYVMDCQGPRSLGTVRPRKIVKAIYEPGDEETWDYRLHFIDGAGDLYRLKITDLTWQYYCQSRRGPETQPQDIAGELTEKLQRSKVYLRIGLARGWKKFPDRCYLQITGVYTFPDYLEGRIFCDFVQK